jgi:hypothetical protein
MDELVSKMKGIMTGTAPPSPPEPPSARARKASDNKDVQ